MLNIKETAQIQETVFHVLGRGEFPISYHRKNLIKMSSVEVLEVPDKSENDKKSYRVIRLTNGLKALLISAPSKKDCDSEQSTKVKSANLIDIEQKSCKTNSKQAACSLCVEVGSFSNPHDIQGLAHFLGKFSAKFIRFYRSMKIV